MKDSIQEKITLIDSYDIDVEYVAGTEIIILPHWYYVYETQAVLVFTQ